MVKVKKESGQKSVRNSKRKHSESDNEQETEDKKIKEEIVAPQAINMVRHALLMI